jgi:hypothetical protein
MASAVAWMRCVNESLQSPSANTLLGGRDNPHLPDKSRLLPLDPHIRPFVLEAPSLGSNHYPQRGRMWARGTLAQSSNVLTLIEGRRRRHSSGSQYQTKYRCKADYIAWDPGQAVGRAGLGPEMFWSEFQIFLYTSNNVSKCMKSENCTPIVYRVSV